MTRDVLTPDPSSPSAALAAPDPAGGTLTRDFTVAVFVIAQGRVLLQWHRKLSRWLPPGGHIEPGELPDDAAVREVLEETGQTVRLIGGTGLGLSLRGEGIPRQLMRPIGIQLEDISPGHQHIDLVYFAVPEPRQDTPALPERTGWYGPAEWAELGLTDEVAAWCHRAVSYDLSAEG
ncbi:MAG TPA: NUDIX domain-containing protein [Thermomicrobiales bacterium]|jgi:8-oxo-dGTP pyrophosphatase MutT (NUDIX family)|nr:NUDIX domain-containing protein [Thermomicrobiales bacterium]